MRKILRDYQKGGLRYCLSTKTPGLLWEMRLGKTLLTIRAEKVRGSKKILVITPYSAMLSWEEELASENQSFIALSGSTEDKKKDLAGFYPKVKYVLGSKEVHRFLPELADMHWDAIIIDEAHHMRNPKKGKKLTKEEKEAGKAKRYSMSQFYIEHFRNVPVRYILTGTPAPNNELDYFNLLHFLDTSYWGFKNYYVFKNKLFMEFGYDVCLKPGSFNRIAGKLAEHCSILSREDVNLPDKIIETVRTVQLTAKMQKMYNKLEKEFALIHEDMLINSTVWETTKYIWLRKLCGGFADKEFLSYMKLNELIELMEMQLKGQQTVILCHYKPEVDKVNKYLQSKGFNTDFVYGGMSKKVKYKKLIDFRQGKIKHLVCQGDSVREGTNFGNADTMIFFSMPDSPVTMQQVRDRIIVVGGDKTKFLIFLVCRNTVEEVIYKRHKNKWNNQQSMKEYAQYVKGKSWKK